MIEHADGVNYSQELSSCDGSVYVIFTNTACTVPLSALTSAPFSLVMGMSVKVKVIAYNAYGDSPASAVGNGAKIVLIPDAPIGLQDNILVTNAFQIGL